MIRSRSPRRRGAPRRSLRVACCLVNPTTLTTRGSDEPNVEEGHEDFRSRLLAPSQPKPLSSISEPTTIWSSSELRPLVVPEIVESLIARSFQLFDLLSSVNRLLPVLV
ncbi:hypothetical protein GQ457_02G031010 [Hibiscus cannabinus]